MHKISGFILGSDRKASACSAGDPGSIPRSGRPPGGGNGTHASSLPGKSHGRRSLVGYSPWGGKELDTTERLHFHFILVTVRSHKSVCRAWKNRS